MKEKTKIILGILLCSWIIAFATDYSLAKDNKPPVFAIPLVKYKDGGSTEYYGLGYKVNKYMTITVQRGIELVKVDFGSWFMRFEK